MITRSVLCLMFVYSLSVNAGEPVTVLTNDWPPYINSENEEAGRAAKMLEVVSAYAGISVDWHYIPYADAQSLLALQEYTVSFPYLYTEARAKKFYYSDALYNTRIKVYFNRRFYQQSSFDDTLNNVKLGRVTGYSYGEYIDTLIENARAFETEMGALKALLNNEIDVLPMTEAVMQQLLKQYFPEQEKLVAAIEQPALNAEHGLHVIASKTPEGLALINRINEAISTRMQLQGDYIQPAPASVEKIDEVLLTTSEGYPAILGRALSGSNTQRQCDAEVVATEMANYYTLPLGTHAIVLQWSSTILHPSHTDRIYKNMMEESLLLILNGPHVGKELCVKNMHINIK